MEAVRLARRGNKRSNLPFGRIIRLIRTPMITTMITLTRQAHHQPLWHHSFTHHLDNHKHRLATKLLLRKLLNLELSRHQSQLRPRTKNPRLIFSLTHPNVLLQMVATRMLSHRDNTMQKKKNSHRSLRTLIQPKSKKWREGQLKYSREDQGSHSRPSIYRCFKNWTSSRCFKRLEW